MQYTRGPFRIASWAHIVNAHIFPGPAVVTALKEAAAATTSSLKTSVSTEISIGTPLASEGEEDHSDDEQRRAQALAGRKSSVVTTTTIHQTVQVARELSGTNLAASSEALDVAEAIGDPPPTRGLLLLAQMSSEGNLMDEDYTQECIEAARAHPDFVMGFISQNDLNKNGSDNFISMTPGVSLPKEGEAVKGDGLGQQYRTPAAVIEKDGCDVVIVGRGILGAKDRANEAVRYRAEAWRAYERKLKN